MKEILITNDDGYESDGLRALIEALAPLAHLTIVAPANEKSACGHSLTITKPLRFVSVGDDFYKLDDGSPADCVYLGLCSLYDDRKPDLVISGINRGANMGEDMTYSGTVAGAMEGVLQGVPSIAVSQVMTKTDSGVFSYDLALAQKTIFTLTRLIFERGFPLGARQFLNVNVPNIAPSQCQGWQLTRASNRVFGNMAQRHTNPRGEEYFWLGSQPLSFTHTENGDFEAISNGFVSITPAHCDLTAHHAITDVRSWLNIDAC